MSKRIISAAPRQHLAKVGEKTDTTGDEALLKVNSLNHTDHGSQHPPPPLSYVPDQIECQLGIPDLFVHFQNDTERLVGCEEENTGEIEQLNETRSGMRKNCHIPPSQPYSQGNVAYGSPPR